MTREIVREPTDAAREADEALPSLDPDWDEAFAWSYGRRLWNVGCG